jgi:hypothetical protein
MKIKRFLLHTAVVLAVLIIAMLAGAFLFIYWGVYNVSALQQHMRPRSILQLVGRSSSRSRARMWSIASGYRTSLARSK